MVKAITQLKFNICPDIRSKLHVVAAGQPTIDTDEVIPKTSAKVGSTTRAAVNTNVQVLSQIGEHAREVIYRHCPNANDICDSKAAGDIVADVEVLVELDVERLFIALKTNLMAHVRAKVHNLGSNLVVEHIYVQGFHLTATAGAVTAIHIHQLIKKGPSTAAGPLIHA
ncbi:hypothetical protein BGX23_011734 [Mortierella sp. AD031]|nr:hypothetical protein BGX23_011734 [Mortierella sp. AD031]KAG0214851.1 hypothetical protein BGX33_001747 [Mortierella sp. NVP41]